MSVEDTPTAKESEKKKAPRRKLLLTVRKLSQMRKEKRKTLLL